MAIRTITVDDYDGESEGATTHEFSLDDVKYQIDLTQENWDKLCDAIADFVEKATVVKGGKPVTKVHLGPDTKEVKAWADAQGLDYPKRGKLPQTLIDAFLEAH